MDVDDVDRHRHRAAVALDGQRDPTSPVHGERRDHLVRRRKTA
jgi:hypothetical protein